MSCHKQSLSQLFALLAAALLGLVVSSSFARPFLPFDCWSYHLPFASRLSGIGGGAEAFVLAPLHQRMFDGFPLLAERLQGALWWITGSLRFVTAINSVSLAGLLAYLTFSLRLPLAPLTFGFLAFPIVAIHATSGMIDLWVATTLAVQALAGIRCLELAREDAQDGTRARWRAHAALFVASAFLAGNSKYMGLALAWVLSAFLCAHAFSRGVRRPLRRALVVLALIAALGAGARLARNLILHGNAFYPIPSKRLVVDKLPPLPVNDLENRRNYTLLFGPFNRPMEFLLSVTEIDWLVRGVEPLYNVDSNRGDEPRRFQGIRTGGLWGPYVAAHLVLLGASVWRRRGVRWELRELLLVRLFAVLTIVIAWLPTSYMLRYWLVWPLLLVVCNTTLYARRPESRTALLFTTSLALAFLCSYFLLPTRAELRLTPVYRYDPQALRARLAPDLLRAIEAGESFCLDGSHYPKQFHYSRALVGGHHSIEQVEKESCRRFPRLEIAAPALRRLPPQAK